MFFPNARFRWLCEFFWSGGIWWFRCSWFTCCSKRKRTCKILTGFAIGFGFLFSLLNMALQIALIRWSRSLTTRNTSYSNCRTNYHIKLDLYVAEMEKRWQILVFVFNLRTHNPTLSWTHIWLWQASFLCTAFKLENTSDH